jgi:hypothetical protein
MRIKALLTTLLLGTTLAGVASADPLVRDHRYEPAYQQPVSQQTPVYQPTNPNQQPYGYQLDNDGDQVQPYAYGQDPSPESTPRSSWINLWEDARLHAGNMSVVPTYDRRLSTIELQGEKGGTFIREIRVQLADGKILYFEPQRMLDRMHAPNLRIDLGPSVHCGVRRVVVVGQGTGSFRVLGA